MDNIYLEGEKILRMEKNGESVILLQEFPIRCLPVVGGNRALHWTLICTIRWLFSELFSCSLIWNLVLTSTHNPTVNPWLMYRNWIEISFVPEVFECAKRKGPSNKRFDLFFSMAFPQKTSFFFTKKKKAEVHLEGKLCQLGRFKKIH